MHHHPSFITVLTAAIRRTPAGLGRATTMRHWVRSGALVVGTALGLSLAGAPVARSAQAENQLAIEPGTVISEIAVNAITQLSCAGGLCTCPAGQIATGGGAECSGRDTLMSSVPVGSPATSWRARCQRLTEVRFAAPVVAGPNAGATTLPVVVDIQRLDGLPPATTHVICATP
jgi:hypothetical protein